MNSSFAFAALAVLSAFPFLAVTATGRMWNDYRDERTSRLTTP
jgi:hypothetical protein